MAVQHEQNSIPAESVWCYLLSAVLPPFIYQCLGQGKTKTSKLSYFQVCLHNLKPAVYAKCICFMPIMLLPYDLFTQQT